MQSVNGFDKERCENIPSLKNMNCTGNVNSLTVNSGQNFSTMQIDVIEDEETGGEGTTSKKFLQLSNIKYLTVETASRETTFNSLSPFLVEKWISKFGNNISVRKNKKFGTLIITCPDTRTALNICKEKTFYEHKINVSPHKILNFTKGIFSCEEIEYLSDQEIAKELKSQNVTFIRRFSTKRSPQKTLFVATFNKETIPEEIKVGYLIVPVRHYIRTPVICFKCWGLNHVANACTKEAKCENCAELKHDGACDKIKCCLCGKDHSSRDKQCPVYKLEVEVYKKMAIENLSYAEAKRRLSTRTNSSYAAKASAYSQEAIYSSIMEKVCAKISGCLGPINSQMAAIQSRLEESSPRQESRPTPTGIMKSSVETQTENPQKYASNDITTSNIFTQDQDERTQSQMKKNMNICLHEEIRNARKENLTYLLLTMPTFQVTLTTSLILRLMKLKLKQLRSPRATSGKEEVILGRGKPPRNGVSTSEGLHLSSDDSLQVIMDADPGADDSMAMLLMLSSHSRANVLAITTVTGNTGVINTTRNALFVLQLANRLDIPVYAGSDQGLSHKQISDGFFGFDGLGDIFDNKPDFSKKESGHAAVVLAEIIEKNPGKITVVCTGPLTNIALALHIYPKFLEDVKDIIILEGSFQGEGNVRPGVEFNAFSDAEASAFVFTKIPTNKPITVVPLEALDSAAFPLDWRINYFGKLKSDHVDFMNKAERISLTKVSRWEPCDQLAASIVLNPAIIKKTRNAYIQVETCGAFGRGAFFRDDQHNTTNVKLITEVNRKLFEDLIVTYMTK